MLGLVHAVSANPATLVQDHQVVAHGIEAGPRAGSLSLRIYDPNRPGDDSVRLTVGRGAAGEIQLAYSGGSPVVAFFQQGYRRRDPVPGADRRLARGRRSAERRQGLVLIEGRGEQVAEGVDPGQDRPDRPAIRAQVRVVELRPR